MHRHRPSGGVSASPRCDSFLCFPLTDERNGGELTKQEAASATPPRPGASSPTISDSSVPPSTLLLQAASCFLLQSMMGAGPPTPAQTHTLTHSVLSIGRGWAEGGGETDGGGTAGIGWWLPWWLNSCWCVCVCDGERGFCLGFF